MTRTSDQTRADPTRADPTRADKTRTGPPQGHVHIVQGSVQFGAMFPSKLAHCMILELYDDRLKQLDHRLPVKGLGYLRGNIDITPLGNEPAKIYIPDENYANWEFIGLTHIRQLRDRVSRQPTGELAVAIELKSNVKLPEPDEHGRIRLVVRNYQASQHDRKETERYTRPVSRRKNQPASTAVTSTAVTSTAVTSTAVTSGGRA